MTAPIITNLDGDIVFSSSTSPVFLDSGALAVVTDADDNLSSLSIFIPSSDSSDKLGVDVTSGTIALSNGLHQDSTISVRTVTVVEGVEVSSYVTIGTISSVDPDFINIDFLPAASPGLVQELLRALTYQNTNSTAASSPNKTIEIILQDKANGIGNATILIAGSSTGTDGADTFLANSETINQGYILDGRAGDDTLELTGGGTFNLHTSGRLTSIETILGSAAADIIRVKAEQLVGVARIDAIAGDDRLEIIGTDIDLVSSEVAGFESIRILTDGAKVTAGSWETAILIDGSSSLNDEVILTTTLTPEQRDALHRRGIETITTSDGKSTTHRAPILGSLGGDSVVASRGSAVFIDQQQDMTLLVDEGLVSSLSVAINGSSAQGEVIGIGASDTITLSNADGPTSDVIYGGLVFGSVAGLGTASLSFTFNENATPDVVQELIRTFTYSNSSGLTETRQISFRVKDAAGRETVVTSNVAPEPNSAPTNVHLTTGDGSSVSINENSKAGFVVATVIADDNWPANELRYFMADNAAFEIDAVTGEIKVKAGAVLDFEDNGAHTVQVTVKDLNGGGLSSAPKTITINLNDVNEAPANLGLVNFVAPREVSAAGTKVADLTAHDPEGASPLTFELINTAGGRFKLGDDGKSIVVADGLLLDYEQAASHTIQVKVTDSNGLSHTETFTINVTDWAAEIIYGSAGNDVLFGGTGNDVIRGGSGNDKINGGFGKDTLYGQSGKDIFVFDTKPSKYNVDKIADYNVKYDTIYLENAVFTKLKAGKLASGAFWKGAKAHDKDDRVIYDSSKGYLYYDADGTGSKYKQVLIATLSKNLKMAASEFYVI